MTAVFPYKEQTRLHVLLRKTQLSRSECNELIMLCNDGDLIRTTDARNELPIEIFMRNCSSLDAYTARIVQDRIINAMKQKDDSVSPLTTKIEVIRPSNATPGLNENLTIAGAAANYARNPRKNVYVNSYTHPSINTLSNADKHNLQARIQLLISIMESERAAIIGSDTCFRNIETRTRLLQSQVNRIKNQEVVKNRIVSDCGELDLLALEYLDEHHPTKSVEQFAVANGDHYFLVMGRKEGSDASDYRTWGDEAVVCGPWGKVFPASEMPIHLKCHKSFALDKSDPIGSTINVCVPFIPSHHRIHPSFSINNATFTQRLQTNANRQTAMFAGIGTLLVAGLSFFAYQAMQGEGQNPANFLSM